MKVLLLLSASLHLASLRSGAGIRLHAGAEEEELHVATAACGGYCDNAADLAKTFLAQAKLDGGPKQMLHVFYDQPQCEQKFHSLRSGRPALFGVGNVTLHDVSQVKKDMPGADFWKPCNSLRVYLPRLFPNLRKLMYMDADTLVVDSIRPLFKKLTSVYMIGEDGGTYYVHPDLSRCPTWKGNGSKLMTGGRCFPWKHGVNAGVYLMDLEKWRAHGLDAEFDTWMQRLLSDEVFMKWHEQDIFNVLTLQHPEYVTRLPCEANSLTYNRWMCYYANGSHTGEDGRDFDRKKLARNERQPRILHCKFGAGQGQQQWIFMHDQVMRAVDEAKRGKTKGAASLCSIAKCGSLVGEASYHDDCWGWGRKRKKQGVKCTPRPKRLLEQDLEIVRTKNVSP